MYKRQAVASHGAAFHSPQEVTRILGSGLDKSTQARIQIMKVLAQLGYTQDVPMPDISTKAKAQQYIGLDMEAEQLSLIHIYYPVYRRRE